MEKYIAVTKENREFLIKTFRTTKMAVWRALTFVERGGDSPRARKIRHLAQQRGGILMIASPAIETMHDADGYMRQYFPNGMRQEHGARGHHQRRQVCQELSTRNVRPVPCHTGGSAINVRHGILR